MKMAVEQVKNEIKEMDAERKEKRKREMREFHCEFSMNTLNEYACVPFLSCKIQV